MRLPVLRLRVKTLLGLGDRLAGGGNRFSNRSEYVPLRQLAYIAQAFLRDRKADAWDVVRTVTGEPEQFIEERTDLEAIIRIHQPGLARDGVTTPV